MSEKEGEPGAYSFLILLLGPACPGLEASSCRHSLSFRHPLLGTLTPQTYWEILCIFIMSIHLPLLSSFTTCALGNKGLFVFSPSVVLDSLRPHGLQQARLPCPSLPPWVCSNSCPLSRWCHSTISSSVTPFSSCTQSFPASGSFLATDVFREWVSF